MIKVELFSIPGCNKCTQIEEEFKKIIKSFGSQFVWRHINLLEEIDYAVELGILTTPAIAINRQLVFSSLPSIKKFQDALLKYRST